MSYKMLPEVATITLNLYTRGFLQQDNADCFVSIKAPYHSIMWLTMSFMALLTSAIQGCHLLPDALNDVNMNQETHAR